MRLYYTGAFDFLEPQTNPNLSIGGFISSTVIPNDRANNLFPDLSLYTIDTGKPYIILVALKNETTADLSLQMWLDYSKINPSIKVEIAAVKPTPKNCLNKTKLEFEKLSNNESSPYFADFFSADGEANKVNLGTLKKGEYLGFWLKRTILKTNILDPNADICALDTSEASLKIGETVNINFSY